MRSRHLVIKQYFTFVALGGVAVIVELVLFSLIVYVFSINFLISSFVSFWFGATVSYALNRKYNFDRRKVLSLYSTYSRYLTVNIFTSIIDLFIMYFAVNYLIWTNLSAKSLSVILVSIINFSLHKTWTFKVK